MKRILSSALLLGVLAALVLALSSCEIISSIVECNHANRMESISSYVDATCTEDGRRTITVKCSDCGELLGERTETITAYGHDEQMISNNYFEATCTEGAHYKSIIGCIRCNAVFSEEKEYVSDPRGHLEHSCYEKEVLEPTCTDGGQFYLIKICAYCSEEYSKELMYSDPLEHREGEEQVYDLIAATCTEGGSYTSVHSCDRCGVELSRESVELDPLGHDVKMNDAKEPTCLDVGWGAYESCTRCSYTTYDEIAALGHDEVTHDGLSPTCEEYGYKDYVTCTRCNYTTYQEMLPLGHDYVNDVCTRCYLPKPTETIEYTLGSGGDHYIVSGLLSDESDVVIPPVYKGLPVTRIDSGAFSGKTSLVSVTLPRTIVSIGASAFYGCTSLAEITIPASVTEIGSSAFYDCYGLTSLTLREGLKTIGDSAFYNCCGLTSLTLREGLNIIGNSAFYNCYGLASIVVPRSVTAIGYSAFCSCSGLESITLPFVGANSYGDSNSYIGYVFGASHSGENAAKLPATLRKIEITGNAVIHGNAFYGCSGLAEIVLSDKTPSIGVSAFHGCTGLTSITIPESVSSIGDSAFYGCSGITEIVVPDGVKSIGKSAFCGCSSLKSITLPFVGNTGSGSENAFIGYIFGAASYSDNSSSVPKSLQKIVMTACNTIPDYAFYECSMLKEVIIPESVSSIGTYAFCRCKGLKNVVVPDSVTSILVSAFNDCTSLESITLPFIGGESANGTKYRIFGVIFAAYDFTVNGSSIPLSLKSVVITGGTEIADSAFSGCAYIREIVLPDEVVSIGKSAFYNCSALSCLELPLGVKSIGSSAFYGCSGLKSINIPASVTEIGESAFYGCSGIEEIKIPDGISKIPANTFYGCASVTEIIVPDSVTYIGKAAFGGCDSLVSITLPFASEYSGSSYREDNHFGYIFGYTNGDSTDYDYSYLSSYYKYSIPASLKNVTVTGGEIGGSVFRNCSGIVSVVLPEGITSIGSNAFYGCSSMTDVSIPASVTYIYYEAFYGCTSLERIHLESIEAWCGITFPSNVGTANPLCYGSLCLNGEKLVRIIIPSGVTEIKRYSFYNCAAEEIIIPDTVKSISEYAFYGCARLRELVIPDSVDSIGISALERCYSLESVTLPFTGAERDVYTNSHFRYIFGAAAYDSSTNPVPANLKTVIITGGSTVSTYSFYGCDTLTTVVLPEGITHIGAHSFYGCSALTRFVIPSGVTGIGQYAFTDCVGLTEIAIPSSLTAIGNYAFRGCSNLKEVTNWSSLQLVAGTTGNGYVAYYAESVYVRADEPVTVGDYVFKSDESGNTLIEYIGNATEITLPKDYNGESYAIGDYAFRYSSLTSVTVPGGVTEIGSYAFPECLTEITLSDGIKTFGQYAFSGCAIERVTVPDSVKVIYPSAFEDCVSLVSVAFGEASELVRIESRVFYGCSALTSVTLNDGIQMISDKAFECCASLEEIKIPDSVMFIQERAFAVCTSLSYIGFGENSSLIELGYNVFSSCTSLTSIRLPDSIDRAWGAFSGSGIHEVGLPLTMNLYHVGELFGGRSYSEEPAMYHRQSQTTSGDAMYFVYDIPLFLKVYLRGGDVKDGLFRNCDTLISVTFNEGAYAIGDGAFFGCTELRSVGGMEYLTAIGDYAFAECESLESIIIGSGVSEISYYAFSGCDALSSATFERTSGWYLRKRLDNGSQYYWEIPSSNLESAASAAWYLKDYYVSYKFEH